MSYLSNTSSLSSVIDAVLTRKGRAYLASNSESFKLSKYAFGDDEVNYNLMTAANIDQDDPNILNLPISEPSTNEAMELINKIYVNQKFINNDAPTGLDIQSHGKYNAITTQRGDEAVIYSNDTSSKLRAWISTYNNIDRPYVEDFYKFEFTGDIDFYSIQFESPAFTDTLTNNFEKIGNNTYIFSAVNKDGTGKYQQTSFGAPTIVFNIRFVETPKFYEFLARPENKDSILITNFLTVTAIDSTRNPVTNIKPATMQLTVKNILGR